MKSLDSEFERARARNATRLAARARTQAKKEKMIEHFVCGHPHTKENSYVVPGASDRCRICKLANARQYYEAKLRMKPLYPNSGCLLAEMWK
jgi:hypothetical protein